LEVLSGDLKERERWDDYMQYYEEAINNTSTDYAPWYVILPTIKKCAVILWVKSFGKKYTDIQTPEMDDKIEKT
jgi:polyphosphate kinase 2 (PPK2 family)